MHELIEFWKLRKFLKKSLNSLRKCKEKIEEIDDMLQKYIYQNEQEFPKLKTSPGEDNAGTIKEVLDLQLDLQEKQIIGKIQDQEETFGQLMEQRKERQLAPRDTEQSNSTDISNTLQDVRQLLTLDYTRNKTLLEWLRGARRRDFSRRTANWAVFKVLGIIIVENLPTVIKFVFLKNINDLAGQCAKEKKETKKLLAKLRRKTELYYDS